jgi:hypothetical protein
METRIQRTLSQWFPSVFTDNEMANDYEMLRKFANYTIQLVENDMENKMEPFKIINLIYLNGTLHDKNAIENEFLSVIASVESPKSLKTLLKLMPEGIRAVYIKTILEN